jgi:hypothetical protein
LPGFEDIDREMRRLPLPPKKSSCWKSHQTPSATYNPFKRLDGTNVPTGSYKAVPGAVYVSAPFAQEWEG